MSLLSAGDEVAARGELLLGVDSRLLHCTNERQLSGLGAAVGSGRSDRPWLQSQSAMNGLSAPLELREEPACHARAHLSAARSAPGPKRSPR